MVLDALSQKPVVMMLAGKKELVKKLQRLDIEVVLSKSGGQMMVLRLQSTLIERIMAG